MNSLSSLTICAFISLLYFIETIVYKVNNSTYMSTVCRRSKISTQFCNILKLAYSTSVSPNVLEYIQII